MRTSGAGLVGMTLFCVYACAKATDSDLGGGYLPRAGRGGSGAKPGASVGGTGGSTTGGTAGRGGSSGGKAGTGTGGTSSGGTGANAGGTSSGAGGSGNATSTGGTDATGGTLNQGGQAGDDGVPPDVLANAKVVLLYVNQQTATLSTQPQMRLYLMNQSDTALDLVHVVVRYWMTAETSAFSLKSYYAASAVSKLALAYVDAADESRIEVTFSSGSIPSHNTDKNAVEFQVALLGDNGATVEQSNDWSFDPTLTGEPQPNDKITVYLAEKLVWGCEPSGKCAGEDGAGGAGGQGGQGGEPGTGGTSPTGGAGGTSGTGVGGGGGQGGEPSAGQGGA